MCIQHEEVGAVREKGGCEDVGMTEMWMQWNEKLLYARDRVIIEVGMAASPLKSKLGGSLNPLAAVPLSLAISGGDQSSAAAVPAKTGRIVVKGAVSCHDPFHISGSSGGCVALLTWYRRHG